MSDVCTVNEVFDDKTIDFLYNRDANLLYRHGQGHHHTTPGHKSAKDHWERICGTLGTYEAPPSTTRFEPVM